MGVVAEGGEGVVVMEEVEMMVMPLWERTVAGIHIRVVIVVFEVFGVDCGVLPNLNAPRPPSFLPFPPISSDGISAMALSGIMGSLWDEYNDMLNKNPVLTKASTSLAGFTIADVLAQKFISQGNGTTFSYPRLARMATFGLLIHGTLSHYFYAKLDSLIPGTCIVAKLNENKILVVIIIMKERERYSTLRFAYSTIHLEFVPLDSSGSSAQNVVVKMLTDQIFWAPIFTAIFLTYTSTLEGKTPRQVR